MDAVGLEAEHAVRHLGALVSMHLLRVTASDITSLIVSVETSSLNWNMTMCITGAIMQNCFFYPVVPCIRLRRAIGPDGGGLTEKKKVWNDAGKEGFSLLVPLTFKLLSTKVDAFACVIAFLGVAPGKRPTLPDGSL